jgi:hypothetical protein
MGWYDWFLVAGVLYTGIGSDLALNWFAGLITGKRLTPDSRNPFERLYFRLHAVNDPNMRGTEPLAGPPDRIPPWNHALAVANGTIVLALEVLIVIGFFRMADTGVVPKFALLAAFAWLMRSAWGEISYWHELTRNEVAPLRGRALLWYWIIGIPQAFFPFLVAERFYAGTLVYDVNPLRLAAFLAVPIGLMVLTRISYRGRVW